MNTSQQLKLQGWSEDANGYLIRFRELSGGPCSHCGRCRGKTVFCTVCGLVLCWTHLNSTACQVRAPDGYRWSHGAAMRVRREEKEAVSGIIAPEAGCAGA